MKALIRVALLALPGVAGAATYGVEQIGPEQGYRLCVVGECAEPTRKTMDMPEQPVRVAAAPTIPADPDPIRLNVMYQIRSAWVGPLGQSRLKRLAELAGKTGEFRVIGTTDALGKNRVNRALAARRADAVRRLLIEYGVSPRQIQTGSTCCVENPPLINPGVRRAVVVLQLPAGATTQQGNQSE